MLGFEELFARVEELSDFWSFQFYTEEQKWSDGARQLIKDPDWRHRYSVRLKYRYWKYYYEPLQEHSEPALDWMEDLEELACASFSSLESQYGVEVLPALWSSLERPEVELYRARRYEYPQGTQRHDMGWRFLVPGDNKPSDLEAEFFCFRYDFSLHEQDAVMFKMLHANPVNQGKPFPLDWPTQQ